MSYLGWLILIILIIAGWAYLQSRKNSTGELQSKEDPKLEARKWIKRHPKTRTKQQSPLAWHARFMSAASAMQFVEKLYQQGAIEVQIDPNSLLKSWVPQVGLYVVRPDADATALLILLPRREIAELFRLFWIMRCAPVQVRRASSARFPLFPWRRRNLARKLSA